MLRRLLLALLLVALLAGTAAFWRLWLASGPKPGPHRVTVAEGASLGSVARQLEQQGVIPGSADTYRAMARIFASSDPVQAGEFEIPAGASGAEVLDILQHGRTVVRLLTIAEGTPSIIVQEKLAVMQTELDAARLLVYRAAHLKDAGAAPASTLTRAASEAKFYATEAAQRIVDEAVQIHGGSGLVRGNAVERLYRDVRALRIYEGTTEIQKLIIARELLKD
jgi:cell division protein YceG involved in septum cleavage